MNILCLEPILEPSDKPANVFNVVLLLVFCFFFSLDQLVILVGDLCVFIPSAEWVTLSAVQYSRMGVSPPCRPLCLLVSFSVFFFLLFGGRGTQRQAQGLWTVAGDRTNIFPTFFTTLLVFVVNNNTTRMYKNSEIVFM